MWKRIHKYVFIIIIVYVDTLLYYIYDALSIIYDNVFLYCDYYYSK